MGQMNQHNNIVILALGMLIGLSFNALPLQNLTNYIWRAESRLTDYSSCISKQSAYMSKQQAKSSCFSHHGVVVQRSKQSDQIAGRMAPPDVEARGAIQASPRVNNDSNGFMSFNNIVVRYENEKSDSDRAFTFDCDMNIIEPYSSATLSCRSDSDAADEIRNYTKNVDWSYASWGMGSSLTIALSKSDY